MTPFWTWAELVVTVILTAAAVWAACCWAPGAWHIIVTLARE